jgi:hypothetical protein
VNRRTAHDILSGDKATVRADTVEKIAEAFKLSVADLQSLDVDELVRRLRGAAFPFHSQADLAEALAVQPLLVDWLNDHPEEAAKLMPWELDELKSLQATGGPLTYEGVAHFVAIIFRKREAVAMLTALAGTELFPIVEDFLRVLHARVQPYKDRR